MIYKRLASNWYIFFITVVIILGVSCDLQADSQGPSFTIQYYSDEALMNSLGDNPRLKTGIYYLQIIADKALLQAPTISIDAQGNVDDVTNGVTTLIEGNAYKYVRTIEYNNSNGSALENILITGTDSGGNISSNVAPTNMASKAAYIDTLYPNVTGVSIVSNNLNCSFAKEGDIVTLTFTCSEPIKTPVVSIAGNSVIATSIDNISWTAVYTMTAHDTKGIVTFSIKVTDLAGNIRAQATTTTTDLTSVTFGGPEKFTVNTSFSIQGTKVNTLQPSQDILAEAQATNNQEVSEQILFIMAFYDSKGEMKSIFYSTNNVAPGAAQNLSASLKLPDTVTGCSVKVFIWEGGNVKTSSLMPLSNVLVISG